MTVIAATEILTPSRTLRPGRLAVEGSGAVAEAVRAEGEEAVPGTLLPGFVDLQCNGAAGAELSDASDDAFDHVGRAQLAAGVTAYCPTLPSVPPERYPRFLDTAARARERSGPRIPGVHLEGPFLNPERAGAHDPTNLRAPDPDWLEGLLDAHPGLVRIVTLAPELPGALDIVRLCRSRGILVAAGHTDASAEEAEAAFEAGVGLVTHLFNAMRSVHHRDPGIAGTALAHTDVRCSLICDGAHVDRRVATFALRALGPDRAVLVSDAVGSPTRDPLRGGFALLDGCLANAGSWGSPLQAVASSATSVPATLIGADDLGRLEPGARADVVLWEEGRVRRVWMDGERRA